MHEAQVKGGSGHEGLHPLTRHGHIGRLPVPSQSSFVIDRLRMELHLVAGVNGWQGEILPTAITWLARLAGLCGLHLLLRWQRGLGEARRHSPTWLADSDEHLLYLLDSFLKEKEKARTGLVSLKGAVVGVVAQAEAPTRRCPARPRARRNASAAHHTHRRFDCPLPL